MESMLTLIRRTISDKKIGYFAIYQCECGNIKEIRRDHVVTRKVVSCGCYDKARRKTHGLTEHPLYNTWDGIKRRCYDPENHAYKLYGGRGIVMFKDWIETPVSFIDWCMLNGWTKDLQIDRRNNDGNYDPDNCRFVTSKINNNNRRDNVLLTLNGKTQTMTQWADEVNMDNATLWARLVNLKWPVEKAIMTPVFNKFNNQLKKADAIGTI